MVYTRMYGVQYADTSKKIKVRLSGSAGIQASTYNTTAPTPQFPGFAYMAIANPTITAGNIQIPFQFIYSNQQLSYRQPFNLFGMSPKWKWITLHGGFRNITYSKYTLAGHSLLGGGFDLNPGKWKISGLYGRLNKATKIDTTGSVLIPVAFERRAFASQIGYGNEKGFIHLNFLKANDDPASVPEIDQILREKKAAVTPSENLVLGLSARIPIVKGLNVTVESAASLLTKDITTPIDIVNDSVLQANGVPRWLTNLFKVNVTTNFFTAVESRLNYQHKSGFNSYFQYTRIAPNYTTFGSYFFQNDLQNFIAGVGMPLLKNKMRVAGSIGRQNDNLNKIKLATSSRIIGNASIGYYGTKFGIDFNYYNYSNDQTPRLTRFADSMRITQTTRSLSLTPRYMINSTEKSQSIIMTMSANSINDYNRVFSTEASSRSIRTLVGTLAYNVNLIKQRLGFNAGISITDLNDFSTLAYKSYGINGGVQKSLLKDKLTTGLNLGVFYIDQTSLSRSSRNMNISSNIGYHFTQKLRLDVLLMYNNAPLVTALQSGYYSDFRTNVGFYYIF